MNLPVNKTALAPSVKEMTEASPTGSRMGEALVNMVAVVSPTEDARGYVQQTLLPVLGPAIEKLLHQVKENGDLDKALQTQAERDGKPKRNKSKERSQERNESKERQDKNLELDRQVSGDNDKPHTPDGANDMLDEPEDLGFDPLAWLADYLRQYSKGSAEKYRASMEQRIAELIRIQEEEAAAQAAQAAQA